MMDGSYQSIETSEQAASNHKLVHRLFQGINVRSEDQCDADSGD
jgi:hypothetical protein